MRQKLLFTSIVLILALLFATNPAEAAKSYYAEYFDFQTLALSQIKKWHP